jgi:hypothetical protein
MKVALCFFGQPRLLNNPYTYLSHKHWILDKYNTDIFIHSWINNTNEEFNYADQVKIKEKELKDSDKIILSKYKPKRYIFEKSRNFSLSEKNRNIIKQKIEQSESRWGSKDNLNWSINNENNHLSQLYSMSKSIELLQDDYYDWVILSRFDTYIITIPNFYNLNKNDLYVSNKYFDINADRNTFSDVLIFGGLDEIKSLNCYNNIDNLINNINIFEPEEFKLVSYYNKFKYKIKGYSKNLSLPYGAEKRIKIEIGVVRSNDLNDLQV